MSEPTPKEIEEIFEHFGDVFGDLFGGGSGRGGTDVRLELELDTEDLARGRRPVTVSRFIGCSSCHGSGRESESDPCPSCGGKGQRVQTKGAFRMSTTCGDCHGSGAARECASCEGERGETREEVLQVTLPPGLRDGQILRLKGKGSDPGDGKGPGDLYLVIRIAGTHAPAIPVRESSGLSVVPWVALGIAVVSIVVAALLLR